MSSYDLNNIIDEIITHVCANCPAVVETHSGYIDGEPISPPEYDCPSPEGVPDIYVTENWELRCKCRDNYGADNV